MTIFLFLTGMFWGWFFDDLLAGRPERAAGTCVAMLVCLYLYRESRSLAGGPGGAP